MFKKHIQNNVNHFTNIKMTEDRAKFNNYNEWVIDLNCVDNINGLSNGGIIYFHYLLNRKGIPDMYAGPVYTSEDEKLIENASKDVNTKISSQVRSQCEKKLLKLMIKRFL